MRRTLPAVAILLLTACGGTTDDSDPILDPRDEPERIDEGHEPVRDPPPGTLVRLTGTVTVDGAAARAGMDLEAELPIEVPEGGRAVIQLQNAGRVELDGPARARLVEGGSAQMLLIRGAAFAVQPPSGGSPRPPLRIGMPSTSIEIGSAGEVYLAAFESGACWVAVLGGSVALTVGEADNRRRLRTIDLGRRRAVAATDRLAEPTEGPTRLSAARAAAVQLAGAPYEPDEEAERAAVAAETVRLDQALRWLETEARRGRELTSSHRDAVQEGNPDESMRLQRELVGHAQALYRLRRLATARWERLRARHLRLQMLNRAPTEDPVALRSDRVAGLLGH